MTGEDRAVLRRAYGGGRASAPRLAVARAAASLDGAFTVDSLVLRARRDDPGIGTATVYRAVAAMLESGFIEQVGRSRDTALYARCDAGGHHHHLVCTGCGTVRHAPCPLDRAVVEDASRSGFVITRHEVSIYGLCERCLRSSEGAS